MKVRAEGGCRRVMFTSVYLVIIYCTIYTGNRICDKNI